MEGRMVFWILLFIERFEMFIIGLVNRHLLLLFLRKRKLKAAIVSERLERHSQITVFKLYPITV